MFVRADAVAHGVSLNGTPGVPEMRRGCFSHRARGGRPQLMREHSDELCRWICRAGAQARPCRLPAHGEEGGQGLGEHGALEFRESIADDVSWGKRTSFPRSVKQKSGETVVFSYIVYKSRADRDRINAKVMKDKRLAKMMELKALPFDAKRMIWGGFKTVVAL